jgi:hypothetical protein
MIFQDNKIKKISIGADLKDAMVFQVGSSVNKGRYKITSIVFADKESYLYDCIAFHIFCESEKQKRFVWKSIINYINISVEYENE